MKSLILIPVFILFYTKLFSQIGNDSLNRILISKLILENEMPDAKDSNSYKQALFRREFIKDPSNPSSYLIVKFGITSTHSKKYFCYLFRDKIILTRSFDINENLSAVLSLFENCGITFASKLDLIEKLVSEIRYDNKVQMFKGNLPQ